MTSKVWGEIDSIINIRRHNKNISSVRMSEEGFVSNFTVYIEIEIIEINSVCGKGIYVEHNGFLDKNGNKNVSIILNVKI